MSRFRRLVLLCLVLLCLACAALAAGRNSGLFIAGRAGSGTPPGSTACDIGPPYTGAIPAAATQAGFTHCAANYDFTKTGSFTDAMGTHTWATMSSWFSCTNTTAAPYLFRYLGSIPCDSSHQVITTDGGVQVFAISYLTSDATGSSNNNVFLTNGTGANGHAGDPFPGQYYMEEVLHMPIISGICSGFCINFDNSTYTDVSGNPCFVASDMEWDNGASATGVGQAWWNPTCGSSGGYGGSCATGNCATPTNGAITTATTTWGNLTTGDGVSQYASCTYSAAGAIQGLDRTAWHSCFSNTAVPPFSSTAVYNTNQYFYIEEGPYNSSSSTWGTFNTNITTYMQRMTVWTCAGYNSGPCLTNPVVTTQPP